MSEGVDFGDFGNGRSGADEKLTPPGVFSTPDYPRPMVSISISGKKEGCKSWGKQEKRPEIRPFSRR